MVQRGDRGYCIASVLKHVSMRGHAQMATHGERNARRGEMNVGNGSGCCDGDK